MGVVREPGCHCVNPILQLNNIPVKQMILNLDTSRVVDVNGNPLIVSGIVTYKVRNSKKAVIDTQNYVEYIRNQALAVMKAICSRYPYQAQEGSNEESLQGETEKVKMQMKVELQERMIVAGVEVILFDLTDLNYAPEIASQMLVRQQADAMI
jgi:regulator of protease activity HflC (stomatin/prohibitin superfamily)